MTDDPRCPARSRITDAQCALPAGHIGRHSVAKTDPTGTEDPDALWIVPEPLGPVTLDELLAYLNDLIGYCRVEGYERMADALTVVRSRIELDRPAFERSQRTLRDLPPLE